MHERLKDSKPQSFARGPTYLDLGVDGVFVEHPHGMDELRRIGEEFRGYVNMTNMNPVAKTPLVAEKDLLAMGFNVIIHGNTALSLGARAIREGMTRLRETGTAESIIDHMRSL